MNTALVPIDGSPAALRALAHALHELRNRPDVQIHLLNVHDAHNTGNKPKHMVGGKKAIEVCATCHRNKAADMIKVMDGRKGWEPSKFGAWGTEFGRSAPRQHLFNLDDKGRSFGLKPEQYHWALKANGDAAKETDWVAIWPMEKSTADAKGPRTAVGAAPWKN